LVRYRAVLIPALGGIWRRRRDSNPRCSFWPHTPLAGEPLQPLGHVSKEFTILTWLGNILYAPAAGNGCCPSPAPDNPARRRPSPQPPANVAAAARRRDQAVAPCGWSRPKARCSARTASSMYLSAIST